MVYQSNCIDFLIHEVDFETPSTQIGLRPRHPPTDPLPTSPSLHIQLCLEKRSLVEHGNYGNLSILAASRHSIEMSSLVVAIVIKERKHCGFIKKYV